MLPPTDPNEPTPQEPLPEHLTFSTRDGGLEVSRRWNSVTWLLLSSFCCFGSCGLYGQGLVEGTVRYMPNGRFEGYIKVPWLGYLMMGVSVLLTVLIVYVVLLSLVNHITVRAEPGRLRVLHHPLPWPPESLDFSPGDIRFETLPGRVRTQVEGASRLARGGVPTGDGVRVGGLRSALQPYRVDEPAKGFSMSVSGAPAPPPRVTV